MKNIICFLSVVILSVTLLAESFDVEFVMSRATTDNYKTTGAVITIETTDHVWTTKDCGVTDRGDTFCVKYDFVIPVATATIAAIEMYKDWYVYPNCDGGTTMPTQIIKYTPTATATPSE